MVRKLKFHEKKLLKKVDFISWDIDNNIHEVKMMKKYYVQKREDYRKYIIPVYRSLQISNMQLGCTIKYPVKPRHVRVYLGVSQLICGWNVEGTNMGYEQIWVMNKRQSMSKCRKFRRKWHTFLDVEGCCQSNIYTL